MASETTVQTSCIQENSEAVECQENIPPEVTAAAGKLKVLVGDADGYSSTQPSGENKPLSDTCTFSTPAPKSSNGEVKAKSRMSGLQSALTPILKYLNIGNKCPSPEPVKHKNSPNLNRPLFAFNRTTANGQKSAAGSSQYPNSDFCRSHFGRSLGDKDASVFWLDDEYLPEITLLDVTCDSTMQLTRNDSALPDSAPATPVTARSGNGTFTTCQHMHLSSSSDLKTTAQKPCHQNKILDPLQSNMSSPKLEREPTDQASSVSMNTTETLHVMNQNNSAGKPSGFSDVQNMTFDRRCIQKSSGSTILEEASATAFYVKNNTLDSETSSKQNGTITQKNLSERHQNNEGKPSPPKICNAFPVAKDNNSGIYPPEPSKSNGTTASIDSNAKMVDTPARANAPLCWLDDRYFPEITLLDVTQDSELSPGGEISSMEVTQDIPPSDNLKNNSPSVELSEEIMTQPSRSDITQSEELSSTLSANVTHTITSLSLQSEKCAGEDVMKVSLTQDISMGSVLENSRTSTEPSEQNIVKSQTSAEDTLGTHPANVTCDISSSSDMSAQCAASQLSISNMQFNTSSRNVTSELHGEPVETSNTVRAKNEKPLTSHDTEMTSKVPQHSPETAASANSTFTIAQSSNLSASTNLNTTAQISSPLNKTLDLSPSNANSPKEESDTKEQASSVPKNATETSPSMNQSSSADKASSSCEVQNTTFDQHSLQKSRESTGLQEAGLQNNTFDSKPSSKQNGTITLSETSSSDSHQNTLDKPSPSKVYNSTTNPKVSNSEVHPPEQSKHNGTTTTERKVKTVDTPEVTLEASPVVEAASEAGHHESKDKSQPGLPMTEGLSDTLGHQSMDTGNKANTFNLDDTLDLRVDSLVTSTPMPNCKMFSLCTEQEDGKILGAQKRLYGDGPAKPVVQVPSDIPSNIVCDRKTFLTQPAVKSLLPPLKVASQLLKYKPASALPARFEPSTSGHPMTRQRTQAEALRNAAAPDSAQGVGFKCSMSFCNPPSAHLILMKKIK